MCANTIGVKHPGFCAHLVTCDRCAARPGDERSTQPQPRRVGGGQAVHEPSLVVPADPRRGDVLQAAGRGTCTARRS